MSVHVVWNTVTDPARRVVCERTIVEVVRRHASEGHWDGKVALPRGGRENGMIPGNHGRRPLVSPT